MSGRTPDAWGSGEAAVVAEQLVWSLGDWMARLRRLDPALDPARVRGALAALRAAGYTIDEESPNELEPPPVADSAAGQAVALLRDQAARLRTAGAALLTAPSELAQALPCRLDSPRAWRGAPPAALVAPPTVELIHMGDLPARLATPAHLAALAAYPALRGLWLFNARLTHAGLPWAALPRLEVLDLSENPLEALEVPAGAGAALLWLNLGGCPLRSLHGIETLQALRFLSLAETALPRAQIDSIRRALPRCHVIG